MERPNLPKPYLFELDTPLIYFNGRLLQPGEPAMEEDNYAEFSHKRFSLDEIVTPGKLEMLYLEHNKDAVQRVQERYMRQKMDTSFISRDELSDRLKRNKVLGLIVNKILPIITSENLENRINSLLADEMPEPEQEPENIDISDLSPGIQRGIERLKGRLKAELDREYATYALDDNNHNHDHGEEHITERIEEFLRPTMSFSRDDKFPLLREGSILYEVLGRNNFMLLEDKVYPLYTIKEYISLFNEEISPNLGAWASRLSATRDPSEVIEHIYQNKAQVNRKYLSRIINKIESSKFRINSKFYLPILVGKTDELEERYKKLIEKNIKMDAIDHHGFQSRQMYLIAQEKERLEQIASRESYEKNGAGFHRYGSDYYVFIRTPPYALRSPHARNETCYVPFDPVRIGVKLSAEGDHFYVGWPVVMESYRHPFLGNARAFKEICLGRWGEQNSSRLNRLPPERRALELLNQGKKTLMMGYRSGDNPYIHLLREEWHNWKTKEEIEREGRICLNEYD